MFNKVFFLGRLGKDPELRYLPAGTPVANFTLAVNYRYKDKKETYWANVVIFGNQAENASKYLGKGSQVFIEGRMQRREWEHNGKKYSKDEVIAERIQFLDKREERENNGNSGDYVPPEETNMEPF